LDVHKKILKYLSVNPQVVKKKLSAFIKQKARDAGADGVVIGLSSGIDSSTNAFLCAEALGAANVLGVSMPEGGVTNAADICDAKEVAVKLGIGYRAVDIASTIDVLRRSIIDFKFDERLPAANLKPRVRMAILYYYANSMNRLVAGSGNRSEFRAGYFTKYGDGAADIAPIGCLYKTQVKQLAAHLGVQQKIIDKIPTAGLWRGQTDESELGLPYEKLDMIYAGLDLKLSHGAIAKAAGVKLKDVERFIERERKTAHKLKVPEIPKL
jgi:NAD+ synthase